MLSSGPVPKVSEGNRIRASLSVCTASCMIPAVRSCDMREDAVTGQEKSREGDRGISKGYPVRCENMNI